MKNIFGIDSKAMQILSKVWDLFMLNLLYILCCIPVVTIGAAQAGLYRSVRAMKDPESDYTWSEAFFKGFKDGFGRITIAWCIMLALIVVVGLSAYTVAIYDELHEGTGAVAWVCVAAVIILLLIQTVTSLFHSNFGCTVPQLFRNAVVILVFNFLRVVIAGVLMWLPLAVFILNIALFIRITPLWLLGYYGICAYFISWLFKVPFAVLEKNYRTVNGEIEEDTEAVDDEEDEVTEE